MIRFILLQNRAGKTRLAKYYVPLEDGEKRHLEYDVHRLIAARDAKFTNFVEVDRLALLIFSTPRDAYTRGHVCSSGPKPAWPTYRTLEPRLLQRLV